MINTLHIDTEGGWGGSSISLFQIVSRLNKLKLRPHVICRKEGPIISKYKNLNIEVEKNIDLYSFSPKPDINNLKLFLSTLPKLLFFFRGLIKLKSFIKKKNIDIVHLNFEGFFLIGFFLKLFTNLPIITHYRSTIPTDSFSHKLISYLIVRYISKSIIFICKTERNKFFKIYQFAKNINSYVIYNISNCRIVKKKLMKGDLIFIGNISYYKGVDRLINLAINLKKKNVKKKIMIYGSSRGEEVFQEKLKNKIKELKLKNIKLMGRTTKPENIIQNAFLLLRPSRFDDPWGRDIIDAFCSGIPCISTGYKNDIILNKKNSFYVKDFNISFVTNIVKKLTKSKNLYRNLRLNIIKQNKALFGNEQSINKFENIVFKHVEK